MAVGRINRTPWGTKLFLTAVWASLVDCISLFHLLKAQYCSLSPNGCFHLPLALHHPPLPPSPTHPPPIDSICDTIRTEKPSQKPAAFKYVACRIRYEMIELYVYNCTIYSRYLARLYHKRSMLHAFNKIFSLVFLEL